MRWVSLYKWLISCTWASILAVVSAANWSLSMWTWATAACVWCVCWSSCWRNNWISCCTLREDNGTPSPLDVSVIGELNTSLPFYEELEKTHELIKQNTCTINADGVPLARNVCGWLTRPMVVEWYLVVKVVVCR